MLWIQFAILSNISERFSSKREVIEMYEQKWGLEILFFWLCGEVEILQLKISNNFSI